jgi:hypothetical protein
VGTPDHNNGCLWRSPLSSHTMARVPKADSSLTRRPPGHPALQEPNPSEPQRYGTISPAAPPPSSIRHFLRYLPSSMASADRGEIPLTDALDLNLVCQGALRVGWTGLGWATLFGGQARIRSHRPRRRVGWGRQVIMRTASVTRQPVYWVRPHPDLTSLLVGV